MDVAEPVPVGSLVAALDVGAAGVVIDTGDELADAALLAELAERERHRLDEAPLMTVAICVYNATGDLDRCLASLRSLRYPRYEVLVCDDGSSDGTVAVGKRYGARVLELGQVGRSHAPSAPVRDAFGDYVVFLDSDEEAEPEWLARLWRMHDRLGAIATGGPNRPFPDASWQKRAVGDRGASGASLSRAATDSSAHAAPAASAADVPTSALALGARTLRAGARPRVRWRHGPRGCAEPGASQLAAVWTVNEFARRSISA